MKSKQITRNRKQYMLAAVLFVMLYPFAAKSQTDNDAIMMSKNYFCTGVMYSHSSWDTYWEGTLKRTNENLGTVSTNMVGVMGNYGISNSLNVLFSVPYTYRSNITIDRNSYYTTEMHLTNKVDMPDMASFTLRTGYRSGHLIAELTANNMTTLGGFDIRRNDMPFPSNKMNATMVGAACKYTFKKPHQLSLVGNFNYTVAGRNMGQATAYSAGAFYAFGLSKSQKKAKVNSAAN